MKVTVLVQLSRAFARAVLMPGMECAQCQRVIGVYSRRLLRAWLVLK